MRKEENKRKEKDEHKMGKTDNGRQNLEKAIGRTIFLQRST